MKFTVAFLSLLPLLGAAIAEEQSGSLPDIDVLSLSSDQYESTGLDQFTAEGGDVSAQAACPPNYPWLCNGRCCPYSICCSRECCGPNSDFCSNGLCYKYT